MIVRVELSTMSDSMYSVLDTVVKMYAVAWCLVEDLLLYNNTYHVILMYKYMRAQ